MRAIRRPRLSKATQRIAGALLVAAPTTALAGGGYALAHDVGAHGGPPPKTSAAPGASATPRAGGEPRASGAPGASRAPRASGAPGASGARFIVKRSAVLAQSGSTVVVRGRLLAHVRNVEVSLVTRAGRGWKRIAHSRTHHGGAFHMRYLVRSAGAARLRVRFAGIPGTRPASAPAGTVVGLVPSVASWYYDAGNTACGFHATYGVANRTLPCGTKVRIAYGGRAVMATVDDRGPYVYGRSFDLNQNTARYLHMSGVAQVLTSV